MSCCNHNCRQGRDCPNRVRIAGYCVPVWAILLGILLLYGIVGQMDYEDAHKQECAPRNYNAQRDACE